MERLAPEELQKRSLQEEHEHRYAFAAGLASGFVVDCACGIGYGSRFLASKSGVQGYLGVDPSEESLVTARERFSGVGIEFRQGTLEALPLQEGSADTFVMLETLEHTRDPVPALASVRKALRADGLLIGSVPSLEYELLCERAYSPNPYHLQRFDQESICALLERNFEDWLLLGCEYRLGTSFSLIRAKGHAPGTPAGQLVPPAPLGVEGSFYFVAGSAVALEKARERLAALPAYYGGSSKARVDLEEVKPIIDAFHRGELMVEKRDAAIASQAAMLDERWALLQRQDEVVAGQGEALKAQEKLIQERDATIASQGKLLEERWSVLQHQDRLVADRDEALKHQEALILDRDAAIAEQGRMLEARWTLLQDQERSLAEYAVSLASANSRLEDQVRETARVAEEAELVRRQLDEAHQEVELVRQQLDEAHQEIERMGRLWMFRLARSISGIGKSK